MKLNIEIDSKQAQDAFAKAPEVMNRNLSRYLDRAAQEVAREARSAAPKAFSTLMRSIHVVKESELSRLVAPGVNYARPVEEGTHGGGMPARTTLLAWLKVKRIESHTPGMTMDDLAFVIGRKIRQQGSKGQPYMKPTGEKMHSRVIDLLRQGVQSGIKEVFG